MTERSGGIVAGIGGTGGIPASCGNEAVNGVISESASENLFESLCSIGDLTARMLVGEAGASPKGTGDEGVEDIRLITLSCGKTIIPHLLAGRTSAGVNSGGVTGEVGPDGGGGGICRIAGSANSRWTGEVGRLSTQSLAKLGGVVRGLIANKAV